MQKTASSIQYTPYVLASIKETIPCRTFELYKPCFFQGEEAFLLEAFLSALVRLTLDFLLGCQPSGAVLAYHIKQ